MAIKFYISSRQRRSSYNVAADCIATILRTYHPLYIKPLPFPVIEYELVTTHMVLSKGLIVCQQ